MNDQLPPIDPEIRDQLTRRSAGRPPQDLHAAIATALDVAPAPRVRFRWPHVAWRTPRFAGAGIGLALARHALAQQAVATGGDIGLGDFTNALGVSKVPSIRELAHAETARLQLSAASAVRDHRPAGDEVLDEQVHRG